MIRPDAAGEAGEIVFSFGVWMRLSRAGKAHQQRIPFPRRRLKLAHDRGFRNPPVPRQRLVSVPQFLGSGPRASDVEVRAVEAQGGSPGLPRAT